MLEHRDGADGHQFPNRLIKERNPMPTVQQTQDGYTASGEATSIRDAYDAMLKGGKR